MFEKRFLKLVQFSSLFIAVIWLISAILRPIVGVPLYFNLVLLLPLIGFWYWHHKQINLPDFNVRYVFVLVIILRLCWAFLSSNPFTSDFEQYYNMAIDIYQNGAAWLNPDKQTGTSLTAAFFFFISGCTHYKIALIPVVLASVLELYLVYKIVSRTAGCHAASWAVLLLGFCPEHWGHTNVLASDVFLSCCITLAIFFYLCVEHRVKSALYIGLILGVAQYIRPNAMLFAVPFLVLFFFTQETITQRIKTFAALVVLFLFLVLPIVVYNYQKLDIISLSPSQGAGKNMLIGTDYQNNGYYEGKTLDKLNEQLRLSYDSSVLADKYKRSVVENKLAQQMAVQRINENKFEFLLLCLKKPVYLWGSPSSLEWSVLWIQNPMIKKIILNLNAFYHRYLLIWAAIVIFVFRKNIPTPLLAIVVFSAGIITATNLLLETQPRYLFMFLPMFVMIGVMMKPLRKINEK